jgi:hypothetical protein
MTLLSNSGDMLDAVTSLSSSIGMILPIVAIIAGGLFVVAGIARRQYGFAILGGVFALFGGLFLPWLLGTPSFLGIFGSPTSRHPSPSETATATPTATPQSTDTQTPPSTAPDLSWMPLILGLLAALILLALLVTVITFATIRARRSVREARKRAALERDAAGRVASAWQGFHDRHNELLRKILHSETDWDSLFLTPALTDPSVPETYAMLRAMRAANTLRDTAGDLPAGLAPNANLSTLPYPASVDAFALAWDVAERNAKRIGQNGVPAAERKLIKEIRTLLDMAENGAASQTERTLAYRRATTLIESLESIHVPAQAIAQLEERQMLTLTATPTTGSDVYR